MEEFIKYPELNWEDFMERGKRMPEMKGNWIYRFRSYYVLESEDTTYPITLPIHEEVYFLNLEEAETHIKSNVRKEDGALYRYVVTQLPIGANIQKQGIDRLYNSQGELIDWSGINPFGSKFDRFFYGRSTDRIRFEEDEIVEVILNDKIHLGIVFYLPISNYDSAVNYFTDHKFNQNIGRDIYGVFIENEKYPISIPVIDVMKLSRAVTEERKNKLIEMIQNYEREFSEEVSKDDLKGPIYAK